MPSKTDDFESFLSHLSIQEFDALNALQLTSKDLKDIADSLAEMRLKTKLPSDHPRYRVGWLMERLNLPFEKAVCGMVRLHAMEAMVDRELLEILGKQADPGRLFSDVEEEALFQTAADRRFVRNPGEAPSFERSAFHSDVLERLARRGIHPVKTSLAGKLDDTRLTWLPDRAHSKAIH